MYLGLVYSVFYLWFEAFPLVFNEIYHMNLGVGSLPFLGFVVSGSATYIAYCLYLKYYLHPRLDKNPDLPPEIRLYIGLIASIFIPVSLLIFGWASRPSVHWIAPVIAAALYQPGIFLTFQSILIYLSNSYKKYTGSILAGNDLFRSTMASVFPLFGAPFFKNLALGPGSSLLAGISILLIVVLYSLIRFGGKLHPETMLEESTALPEDWFLESWHEMLAALEDANPAPEGDRPGSMTAPGPVEKGNRKDGEPTPLESVDFAGGSIVLEYLEKVLKDNDEYRALQSLLDLFHILSLRSDITLRFRSSILKAMLRLSETSSKYPALLAVGDVQKASDEPLDSGGFCDIYQGLLGSKLSACCLPSLSSALICLISPWVEKGSLHHFLRESRSNGSAVDHKTLIWDIANGLSYLHGRKIVHADLKSDNILLTSHGRACLADFGLSELTDSQVLALSSVRTSPAKGTLRYWAPEIILDRAPYTYQSDVYAFALVCYEVYSSLRPFHGVPDSAVIIEIHHRRRPSRPVNMKLSNEIWSFIESCWDDEPSCRPRSPQLLDALKSAFGGIEGSPAPNWDQLEGRILSRLNRRDFDWTAVKQYLSESASRIRRRQARACINFADGNVVLDLIENILKNDGKYMALFEIDETLAPPSHLFQIVRHRYLMLTIRTDAFFSLLSGD
uniref:Protein kinase domain-containing protein n=1 Tax=Moniliophthora roreri TaxID=221103 RepID=A0A0W0FIT5_MONRR